MTADLWLDLVGIPLDEWIAAKTPNDLAELVERRERGEFKPKPFTGCANCVTSLDDLRSGRSYPVCNGDCAPCRYHGPYHFLHVYHVEVEGRTGWSNDVPQKPVPYWRGQIRGLGSAMSARTLDDLDAKVRETIYNLASGRSVGDLCWHFR